MLKDMESQLEIILDSNLKEMMKESYASYAAKAYRSSIIVSCICVYEDLRAKVRELSTVNNDARNISTEVERRVRSSEVFESYLEDQLSSKNILSPDDKRDLVILRDIRNRCAHPTGHKSNAEEARYVYSMGIEKFLSKPLLKVTDQVDFILSTLNDSNHFPFADIKSVSDIVSLEIEHLHTDAYPMLLNKVVPLIEDANQKTNARYFIAGLTYISKDNSVLEDDLVKYLIDKKASVDSYKHEILLAISSNCDLFYKSNSASQARIRKIIIDHQAEPAINLIGNNHAASSNFFTKIIAKYNGTKLVNDFHAEVISLIDKLQYNRKVIKIASCDSSFQSYIKSKYISCAGSSTWATANAFANSIIELDELCSDLFSESEILTLFLEIENTATQYNSFDSKALRDDKFNKIPFMKNKLTNWLAINPQLALPIINQKYSNISTVQDYINQYL